MNAKEYALQHFNNFGLLDYQGNPITRADMLALLNILESQGESLDTMHETVANGEDTFLNIWHTGPLYSSPFGSDSELYHAILENFSFLTDAQFIDYIMELWAEYEHDTDFIIFHDMHVIKTADGYVIDNRF